MKVPQGAPIKKRVVFILGAGASMPYGFPSGRGLVDLIIRGLWGDSAFDGMSEVGLRRFLNGDQTARDALQRSRSLSIDDFLRDRPDLRSWGKQVIADRILRAEAKVLSDDVGTGWCEKDSGAMDWLRILWDKLKAPPEEFAQHNIAFVTLNYDRFLEHYLAEALANTYAIAMDTAWDTVSKIPIVHLHGLVGPYEPPRLELPFKADLSSGIPFGAVVPIGRLAPPPEAFHLWWEEEKSSEQLQHALRLLDGTEFVVGLGVGHAARVLQPLRPSNKITDRWF